MTVIGSIYIDMQYMHLCALIFNLPNPTCINILSKHRLPLDTKKKPFLYKNHIIIVTCRFDEKNQNKPKNS